MSARYPLSPAQLSALRALADGETKVNSRTGQSLVKKGYARYALTLFSGAKGFELTPTGRAFIEDYVERTGDGPEDLKAMFRF